VVISWLAGRQSRSTVSQRHRHRYVCGEVDCGSSEILQPDDRLHWGTVRHCPINAVFELVKLIAGEICSLDWPWCTRELETLMHCFVYTFVICENAVHIWIDSMECYWWWVDCLCIVTAVNIWSGHRPTSASTFHCDTHSMMHGNSLIAC